MKFNVPILYNTLFIFKICVFQNKWRLVCVYSCWFAYCVYVCLRVYLTISVKHHSGKSVTDCFSQNSPGQKGTVALHV